MLSISINNADLNRFFSDINKYSQKVKESVQKEVTRATYAVEMRAKTTEAPVSKKRPGATITPSGNLRRNIYSKINNGKVSGIVGVNVNYAIFVHQGTRPHEIRIKNKKVLAAYMGRNSFMFFGKRIMHPGTKANPFLQRAVNKEQSAYIANLQRILTTV